MPSIALIGPDGAGKTTLTRMLEQSGVVPVKYLYMGRDVDVPDGTFALPTSRLLQRLRARARSGLGNTHAAAAPSQAPPRQHVTPWALVRLGNQLAEEWLRLAISGYYQRIGYVVLYDRHYVFDFDAEIAGADAGPLDRRLHGWCVARYARPDLVLFLDAPATLLYRRKRESSIEELERRRQAFLRMGERTPGFVRVDAARPIEAVYGEVVGHVARLFAPPRPVTAEGAR